MSAKFIATLLCMASLGFAVAQPARTAKEFYNQGIALQDEGKYAEALESFKKAIAKDPNYKESLYSAGWNCNELKRYSEAFTYLQKARQLWPDAPKVYLEIGYVHEKQGRKDEAIANYNKCLELDKEYALAYKYLGIVYYDNYEYQKALDNLIAYLELKPDSNDDDVYFRKAVSENELGLYTEALTSINKANELNPSDVKYLNEVGYTYYLQRKADEALSWYDKALGIDPKSLTALNGRANVYRKLKSDIPEAIRLYQRTLDVDPKNLSANYYLGWCYNDLEKYNDAIPYLKKVIQEDRQYVSAYTELGYSEYALKNYDDALATLKKGLAIERTELSVYYSGLCYVGKKDKQAALTMVTELKGMKSDYADELQTAIDKM